MKPVWECDYATVYQGDCLPVLMSLPSQSVDAVICDPPYSSGGLMRSDRNRKTTDKYVLHGTLKEHLEFFGDNRDQRSFTTWASIWLSECFHVTKEGGIIMVFTDWRQLPAMSDAIQCGGWVWRGIVPWDKTESVRPQLGFFRAQCEYVLTGSRGSLGLEQERQHVTGKPVSLMRSLMDVLPVNSVVLDPFAGSGTVAVAAKELQMKSISVEMSIDHCHTICQRLRQDVLPMEAAP